MKNILLWLVPLTLILVACGGSIRDEDDISLGDELLRDDFETQTILETTTFNENNASLSLDAGRYIIDHRSERSAYIWGQGGEAHQDVAVQADTESLVAYSNNLYGVMCRVDEDGAGYVFLISNDGFGAIARSDGRSLSFLLPWHEHDSINAGTDTNTIRGVCVGNYLALFVNDTLIGDVEDDTYSAAGGVGLLAGVFVEHGDTEGQARIAFDNLTVSVASLDS